MKWWIDRPRLLGSHNPRQSELRIEGLTMIISLVDPRDEGLNYNPAIPGVRWVEIPVQDFQAPTMDDLRRFVSLVESATGTVLVHCQGGNGRTGTFGAAWLIHSRGMTSVEAVYDLRKRNPDAVETGEQRAAVNRFQEVSEGHS